MAFDVFVMGNTFIMTSAENAPENATYGLAGILGMAMVFIPIFGFFVFYIGYIARNGPDI